MLPHTQQQPETVGNSGRRDLEKRGEMSFINPLVQLAPHANQWIHKHVRFTFATDPTLERDLQKVVSVFVHESLGLGEGGQGPAVVEVTLLHRGVEVVVDEVGGCGHAQIPAKGLQQQKLHFDQIPLVEDQIQAAHETQRVQLFQFGNPVLLLLKLTWTETNKQTQQI